MGPGGPMGGPPYRGGGFMHRGSRRPYNNRGGGHRPPYNGPSPAKPAAAATANKPTTEGTKAVAEGGDKAETKKPEAAAAAATGPPAAKAAADNGNEIEEGQIEDEKPLNDILRGRHVIVYCNEQSKFRRLPIEWEQISETGPPHDKTFTWSMKMGADLVTIGVANSKKGAKQKAAEDMARKLDAMGPPAGQMARKRPFPAPQLGGGYNSNPYANPTPQNTQFQLVQQSLKKARKSNDSSATPRSNEQSALDKKSQNNPISKLYEHCRQKHWPEPCFETIAENVLDTVKTMKGFTLKKTEFTIQCEIQAKKFVGVAMTKKEAKHNAAAAAWAEFGVGVAQDSISSMLQSQRDVAKK